MSIIAIVASVVGGGCIGAVVVSLVAGEAVATAQVEVKKWKASFNNTARQLENLAAEHDRLHLKFQKVQPMIALGVARRAAIDRQLAKDKAARAKKAAA
jgi:uncharacterized membrane-anchored protein YhcB (DUF1043 family)